VLRVRPRQRPQRRRPVEHEGRSLGDQRRLDPVQEHLEEDVVPVSRRADRDAGHLGLGPQRGRVLVAGQLDPGEVGEQLAHRGPCERRFDLGRRHPTGGPEGQPHQRLAVVGQRAQRRLGPVPLEHGELGGVVRARLLGPPAAPQLVEARHPGRDQLLEVVLGRGDQPVALPRRYGLQMHLLPRRADARRGLDLDEPLPVEPVAHGAANPRPRLQVGGPQRANYARLRRSRYSPVRVSILITSPTLMNSGTLTLAPVLILAGLVAPVAVSPRKPGSASVTACSMKLGSVTPTARPLKNSTSTLMFSGMNAAWSPTVSRGICTWSYVDVSMNTKESASPYRYCIVLVST